MALWDPVSKRWLIPKSGQLRKGYRWDKKLRAWVKSTGRDPERRKASTAQWREDWSEDYRRMRLGMTEAWKELHPNRVAEYEKNRPPRDWAAIKKKQREKQQGLKQAIQTLTSFGIKESFTMKCASCDATTIFGTPLCLPPDKCVAFECDGCGSTFVNAGGECVWPSCTSHGHSKSEPTLKLNVLGTLDHLPEEQKNRYIQGPGKSGSDSEG